jgi:hypothetical protein
LNLGPTIGIPSYVRFWHKAGMLNALTNVRFWGKADIHQPLHNVGAET